MKTFFLCASLLMLSACQIADPSSCEDEDRKDRRSEFEQMSAVTRDSIVRAFSDKERIQQVELTQEVCHFRATVRVDSFATRQYAVDQSLALVRALYAHAPHETAIVKKNSDLLGEGIYDYIVTVRKEEADTTEKPLTKMVKRYDASRVRWVQ